MKIGLVDVDGHNFPNLVLMKLSAWHKSQEHSVEFADAMFGKYDIVYKSKVFTFTPDDIQHYQADTVIKAGTGYGDYETVLPYEIEHICPDYNLYPLNEWYDGKTAYGFLTRGCICKCPWCIVPHKEGFIKPHADLEEFIGPHKKAVLLDNNVLACSWGLEQIEKIIAKDIKVDFNQGLDARIIAKKPEVAKLLSRVKWIDYIRMAYDDSSSKDAVFTAIDNLKHYGVKPYKMFFYVLIKDNLHDAIERVMSLDHIGAIPFVQPYRDFKNYHNPTNMQSDFARWVNHRATFKSCIFERYVPRKGFICGEYLKQ